MELANAHFLRGTLNLEQGQIELAHEACELSFKLLQSFEHKDNTTVNIEKGRCELLRGRLAYSQNDLEGAHQHIVQSVRLMQEGKSFLEEARSRYWLALLYSKQGAIPQAQAELLAVRDVFTHFGAVADLAETMKLLEQLGRSISP